MEETLTPESYVNENDWLDRKTLNWLGQELGDGLSRGWTLRCSNGHLGKVRRPHAAHGRTLQMPEVQA